MILPRPAEPFVCLTLKGSGIHNDLTRRAVPYQVPALSAPPENGGTFVAQEENRGANKGKKD